MKADIKWENGIVTEFKVEGRLMRPQKGRDLSLIDVNEILEQIKELSEKIQFNVGGLHPIVLEKPKEQKPSEKGLSVEKLKAMPQKQKYKLAKNRVTRIGETDGEITPKQVQGIAKEIWIGGEENSIKKTYAPRIMKQLLSEDNCWSKTGAKRNRKYLYDREKANAYIKGQTHNKRATQ